MICICGMPSHETAGRDEIKVGTNVFGEVLLQTQDRQGSQARAVLSSLDVEVLIACLSAASSKVDPSPAAPPTVPPKCRHLQSGGLCGIPGRQCCRYSLADMPEKCGFYSPETAATPPSAIDQQAREVIDGWAERLMELQRKVFRVDDQLQDLTRYLLREKMKMSPEEAAEAVVKSVKAAEARVRMAEEKPMSPREACAKHHVQACHCCERLACCDNTSPGAELLRAARDVGTTGPAGTLIALQEAVKKQEMMG